MSATGWYWRLALFAIGLVASDAGGWLGWVGAFTWAIAASMLASALAEQSERAGGRA